MLIVNNWWKTKRSEIKKTVWEKFHQQKECNSPLQTTDIEKIVLSSRVAPAIKNKQLLENTIKVLLEIAQGQKVVATPVSHKSIASFKLRGNIELGCRVTLRKRRAWNFLFNLINLNLPLITNFQGISTQKFDRSRSYNFGIEDLNIFPTVPYDLVFSNQGLQVTIVFKSTHQTENIYFLRCLGFPFAEKSTSELKKD